MGPRAAGKVGLVLALCGLGATGLAVVGAAASAGTRTRAVPKVTFVIDTAAGRRAISPLIYGINADKSVGTGFAAAVAEARPGLIRLGGNRWTAYNWENNDSNAGSDYRYENDDYLTASTTPGAAILPTVKAAHAEGATSIVTVPIAGLVAGDRSDPVPLDNPPDAARFKIDTPTDPAPLTTTPDLKDAYVYQDQFAYWLAHAAPGAPVMFELDNEPDLWHTTHQEIHPGPATYAELLAKDVAYATALKKVWPSAPVLGPVSYGWYGYTTLQGAPDSTKDGNFLIWWMRQIRAADRKAGKRLVNALDLHWYPEATGGGVRITGTDTSPAVVAAREQAPRSLWDPKYVEASWITQYSLGGKGIDLIPRLRGEIKADDPGLGLDFTEWNYGAGQSISGGIATADVLGIFGRYGVGASAMWPLNGNESYTYGAIAMYRSYDGHGSAFGDTEVKATTTDPAQTSVYGSIASTKPGRVVIVAVNKLLTPATAKIELTGGLNTTTARVYTLTSASSKPRASAGLTTTGADTFTYSMPAQSVSVIVPATAVAALPSGALHHRPAHRAAHGPAHGQADPHTLLPAALWADRPPRTVRAHGQ
jgi:hypothetical protein